MRSIGSTGRFRAIEVAWFAFALANVAAMAAWPTWETIPFHFIWVSLTLLYGFRIWRPAATSIVLVLVAAATGFLILVDAAEGTQPWGELFEVPLMSAMFLAMVWHARRRQEAQLAVEREAEERASLLKRQEHFLHDVSHELRTPVTIARGHLELLRRGAPEPTPEIEVAFDELGRIERIVERLLLLAKTDHPGFVVPAEIDVEPFLEEVFMRWSEVAPRAWRLGHVPAGVLRADPEALRIALDALLENAVKYTSGAEGIELRAQGRGRHLLIEVADEGRGVSPEALTRIFERFARADAARTRSQGGVGLGLAIVDAIAKAHGGTCTVRAARNGSTFSLRLPGFSAARQPALEPAREGATAPGL
ncbi:MAG TPA: HAMP domain-containing sensor histidine kinase [Gaiellaceae bacterium]|jgi:signal transduction histidine kinase|nr:HAMP domain-containing sensor histidine kinase [Gaiellaceae bacterium]